VTDRAPPPYSAEAEVAVIGALLVDRAAVSEVRPLVEPADFFRTQNRLVFEAEVALFDSGQAIDVITVAEHLKASGKLNDAGGFDYVSQLVDMVPTAVNVAHHARIVREKASRRRLIATCLEVSRQAAEGEDADEVFAEAQRLLLGATEQRGSRGFRHVGQAVIDAMAVAEQAAASEDGISGIRSGIPRLDHLTSGFEPGGLTVLAARPAMGKSALGWQFGERAAMDGIGVCVASYEMADAQLGRRGLARLSNIDSNRIRRGELDIFEWDALTKAGTRLGSLPIWTNDQPPHEVEGLRGSIHRHMTRHETGLVVVDYLQQMSGPKGAGNRNNEVEHISRGLKRMAVELGVHVVALAQLSRGVEHRTPPRPILSDLRDSGAIEQDADNVLLLWRPEYYFDDETPDDARARWQGRAELILAKQRDGEVGRIMLTWEGSRLRFTEIDEHEVRKTA
jgi:replicative DNA helicase